MSNRKIYDTVFRHYFNDKTRFMSLGNALLDTNLTNPNELIFNTLDGTFYSSIKNDISCLFGSFLLFILEHQTTDNENMPFRFLCYVVELFQSFVASMNYNMYDSRLKRLPSPTFFVMLDRSENDPEHKIYRLSDAFGGDDRYLDLKVDVYNIHGRANPVLKSKCDYLRQYGLFSAKHRSLRESGMDADTAIRETIKYCRANNIMLDYIEEHESEVFRMLHYEWDEEEAKAGYFAAGEEKGMEKGVLNTLKNILQNSQFTLPQAMNLMGIAPERQAYYAAMVSK